MGGDSNDDEGEDVVFEVTLAPSGDEAAIDEEELNVEEFVKANQGMKLQLLVMSNNQMQKNL